MSTRAVMVRIESIHSAFDGASDMITTLVKGKWLEKNGINYVSYAEPEESGLGGTHTLLKWDGESLCLTRFGGVQQEQIFVVGETTSCVYQTEFLQLPLLTTTQLIDSVVDDDFMDIYVEYFLLIGDQEQGLTRLRILVGEDLGIGH